MPAVLAALYCSVTLADENDWFIPLGKPPVASPRNISAGEAFPPLPLPATPLRRTERKRSPKPPTIGAKVIWGESAAFTYENGAKTEVSDWNLCPADFQQLMRKAGSWAGLSYSCESVTLSEFHNDPSKLPLLFFSGGRTMKFDDRQIEKLRSFVLKGGMLMFDSIAGSPYFHKSSRDVVARAFPEFAIRMIPADHPVYHILYDIDKVKYPKNLDSDQPMLEGVYVGSRIGALISRYGLGCSWDDHEVPFIEQAIYYDVESGNKLGLNILAYAVGYAGAGLEEAKPELFGAIDEKRPTDEFVFAQIRHQGSWNVHPGGAASLLRRLRQDTALSVSLKRIPVTLGKDDISSFPFLYMTGLDDFQFSGEEVASLRQFLRNSGTLLISNGLGMKTFDNAVRRELRKVLPESVLAPVPLQHPLYSSVFNIADASYTPAVVRTKPDLNVPYLEGIHVDDNLRVIYSPYDLEASWQGCEHPLARAFESQTGIQLGINIAMYAATH